MTSIFAYKLTLPEPPSQEEGPRYAAVEKVKQVSKKYAAELAFIQVCHPLMKNHDTKVNNNQPTNKHAENPEHSLISPNKGQLLLPINKNPAVNKPLEKSASTVYIHAPVSIPDLLI